VVGYHCRAPQPSLHRGNLRVVDASIFPEQIGGNPNVPIMAIAEKIGAGILAGEQGRTLPRRKGLR